MKRFLLSFVTLVLTLSLPAAAQVRFTPRDSVLAESILQRLPERFQRSSAELRKFVQKETAVVSQRNFAGLWIRPAADKRDVRNRMMRTAERALGNQ